MSLTMKYGPWVLLALLSIFGYTKYSKEIRRRETLEVENRQLRERIEENSSSTEVITEKRPDGTTVIIDRRTDTSRKTDRQDNREASIFTKEELIRMSKSNYTVGVAADVADIKNLSKFTYDAGMRIWNLPIFGVIQYKMRGNEVSAGLRVEF